MRFTPNDAAVERIQMALENFKVKEFLNLIHDELDNPGVPVEASVAKLRSKLSEISDSSIPSKRLFNKAHKKYSYRKACPWFDEECKLENKALNRAGKAYQSALKNHPHAHKEALRDAFFSQKSICNKILKSKRKIFNENRKEKLWNLKSSSPKDIWKMLAGQKKPTSVDFDKNTLFDYFNNLLNTNESNSVTSEAEELE